MKSKEMYEAIKVKNEILCQQTKRIKMLEVKMTQWRRKYFVLKYKDSITLLRPLPFFV
jgi:hypothetical protein